MFTTPTKREGKLGEGRMKIVKINVGCMRFYFRKINLELENKDPKVA
jgi:hypothetical protein